MHLTLQALLNGLYLFDLHLLNTIEHFEICCRNFELQAKLVVCSCFLINFPSCLRFIRETFKTTITGIYKIIWFSMMLKNIFFGLFIMCLFLKECSKTHGIESAIWLHRKSFIPYIIYSNKPRKRYVLDTYILFATVSVNCTT